MATRTHGSITKRCSVGGCPRARETGSTRCKACNAVLRQLNRRPWGAPPPANPFAGLDPNEPLGNGTK